MIRDILFDLDDTLFDFHRAEGIALSEVLRMRSINPTPEVLARYSTLNREQWEALERGETTRDRVKVERFEKLFHELGLMLSASEAAEDYERRLSVGHYFIDGAEALLRTLYPRYRLYLVSNGTLCVQKGRLKSANISHYFRGIFISEQVGCEKPNPAFFTACFDTIEDFSRERCAIVGDSLTSDILGGLNAGIRTIWFHPRGRRPNTTAILPDYELERLADLPALLETL